MTETVINNMGEPEKAEHYTLYVGLSQPDEQSVKMSGAIPAAIRK